MMKLIVLGSVEVFRNELNDLVRRGRVTVNQADVVSCYTAFVGRGGADRTRGHDRNTMWVNCDISHRLEDERLALTSRFGPASNLEAAIKSMMERRT